MAGRRLAPAVRSAALAGLLAAALVGCGPRGEAVAVPAEAVPAGAVSARDGVDRAVDAGAEHFGVLLRVVELWRRIAEMTVVLARLLPAW